MRTSIFWTKPYKLHTERNADPLGIDALREAMSDVLAPCLTKGTHSADEYLWVLIGLKWGATKIPSGFEVRIWPKFQRFERALKLYWWKFHIHRHFNGVNEVRNLAVNSRPNLNTALLKNERAAGLLGTYITSLRDIGLVDKHTLRPTDSGFEVVAGLDLQWDGRNIGSWERLQSIFSAISITSSHKTRLGGHLFADQLMLSPAKALISRASALKWAGIAEKLPPAQKRIAKACHVVNAWEHTTLQAFELILQGKKNLPGHLRKTLKQNARHVLAAKPFPPNWENTTLRDALLTALLIMSKSAPEKALLTLHKSVISERGGRAPWISALGKASLVEFNAPDRDDDYRFVNIKKLLRETKWRIK